MGPRSRVRLIQGLLLAAGAPVGWLTLRSIGGHAFGDEISNDWALYLYLWIPTMVAFGTFGAVLGAHEDELELAGKRFELEAVTDPLTGLHNRRYLVARLDEAVAEAARERTEISLVLLDLDHFKSVNDRFGHPLGDRVLRRVGQAIEAAVRGGETSARTGGEEFAVILPGAGPAEALEAAKRVRRHIGGIRFPVDGGPERVSASAGVATATGGQATPGRLLDAADKAMYQAKRNGRDRTVSVDMRRSADPPP